MNQKLPVLQKETRSIDAFSRAFFELLEDIPFSKITISMLLKKSGYSRTAFYSNFTDKYAFVEAIMENEVACHVHAIYDTIAAKSNNLIENDMYLPALCLFQHAYEQKRLYHALFSGKIEGWDLNTFSQRCGYYYEKSIEISPDLKDFDMEIYRYIATFQFIAYIMFWDKKDYCYTPQYMAKQVALIIKLNRHELLQTIETK